MSFGSRTVPISHNSDGFRDVEPVLDGRRSIMFVGDSFVWGTGLEPSARFTDKLRARHPEWALYNCGVVGYGTDQEYLLLQRYFQRYHPQVVFLLFCTENDFFDNCSNGGGIQIFKPYFTIGGEGLKPHGIPVPFPDYVFCQKHPYLSKPYLVRLAMRAWGNVRCPPGRPFERGITFTLLDAVKKFVCARNAAFYVGLTTGDPELERFLEKSQTPFINLNTNLRLEGDFHWSGEGNSFVAGKIESFLKEQKVWQNGRSE